MRSLGRFGRAGGRIRCGIGRLGSRRFAGAGRGAGGFGLGGGKGCGFGRRLCRRAWGAGDEGGKFGLALGRTAALIVARAIAAGSLFTRPILATLVTGSLFPGSVVTRAIFPGAIFPPLITRTILAALLTGPVLTGPILAPLLAVALIPVAVVAVAILPARLGVMRARFGQIHKICLVIATKNSEGFGAITALAGLLAAILCPLMPVARTMAIATLPTALLLARLLFGGLFAHRLGQKPRIVLGMLKEVLSRHPVIRQLGIACQKLILFNDLLRRAAHLAFGARAVEDTVDDIAERARAVLLGTRARLGRAHLVL